MKRVNTIKKAAEEVIYMINNYMGSNYFVLEYGDCEYQIRVSDHSARVANNKSDYDGFFSFIKSWNKQDCNMMNEWEVDEEGYNKDYERTVSEILEWELE
jgi:hypothetical protein